MPEPFQGGSGVLKSTAQKNADCSLCFPHTVTIPFLDWRSEIGFSFGICISASAEFQVCLSFISQRLPYLSYTHTYRKSLQKNTASNRTFDKADIVHRAVTNEI